MQLDAGSALAGSLQAPVSGQGSPNYSFMLCPAALSCRRCVARQLANTLEFDPEMSVEAAACIVSIRSLQPGQQLVISSPGAGGPLLSNTGFESSRIQIQIASSAPALSPRDRYRIEGRGQGFA